MRINTAFATLECDHQKTMVWGQAFKRDSEQLQYHIQVKSNWYDTLFPVEDSVADLHALSRHMHRLSRREITRFEYAPKFGMFVAEFALTSSGKINLASMVRKYEYEAEEKFNFSLTTSVDQFSKFQTQLQSFLGGQ